LEERVEELWYEEGSCEDETDAHVSGFAQESNCVPADTFVQDGGGKGHQDGSDSDVSQTQNMFVFEVGDRCCQFAVEVSPFCVMLFPGLFALTLR
jgi:hypothetical protein